VELCDGGYLVAGGCSDGVLRVWRYSNNEFILLRSLSNHGRCVLKVALIEISRGCYCLVSAATDGRVFCWRIAGTDGLIVPDEPCLTYHAHQSGVNGMDTRLEDGVLSVISCGDDCSVSIFSIIVEAEWSLGAYGRDELAHSSNVTGVCFVAGGFISCSADQDLHVWRVEKVNGTVRIEKMRTLSSCIPDICDMSVSTDEDGAILVAVCGQGAQILKL
jgi:WD40 repeat protein